MTHSEPGSLQLCPQVCFPENSPAPQRPCKVRAGGRCARTGDPRAPGEGARGWLWGTVCQRGLGWGLGPSLGCRVPSPGAWVPGGWRERGPGVPAAAGAPQQGSREGSQGRKRRQPGECPATPATALGSGGRPSGAGSRASRQRLSVPRGPQHRERRGLGGRGGGGGGRPPRDRGCRPHPRRRRSPEWAGEPGGPQTDPAGPARPAAGCWGEAPGRRVGAAGLGELGGRQPRASQGTWRGRPRPLPARRGGARARWPPGPGCAEEAAAGAAPGSHGRRQVPEPRAGSPQSRAAAAAAPHPSSFPALPSRARPPSPTGEREPAMALTLTVDVAGPGPWGFRITGGRDFHSPIMVTKVTERGKAEAADLRPGDIIVAINGESAEGMLHAEAQSKIRHSPSPLRLQLDRSPAASPRQTNGESSVEVLATRFQGSVRTHSDSQSSLRSSCSSPCSSSPQPGSPFSALPPSSPHTLPGEAVVSRSFQNLAYSPGPTAANRFSYGGRPGSRQAGLGGAGDAAVLVLPPSPGPCPSSPRLSADSERGSHLLDEDSEVYKMLQENREGRVAPRQSSSFRLLQEALEAEEKGGTPAFLPSLLSPQSSLPTSRALATPPKLHTCEKCGTSIVNHAVRIQEGRYRHPGCYSCADCGLNLKMRGHFWVGDELYCEKHARQRYSSPPTLSSQA
uniref:PDZ and LIM domain protein 2 n=1 Tax=Canis lupus familiaris TaxID=9615 RepID=A0A8C0NZ52_CANLF